MTNIERAIERLQDVTKIKCGPEFSHHYAVDLNDCRAEIVALMRADNEFPRQGSRDEAFAALAALAAKILEGEKS